MANNIIGGQHNLVIAKTTALFSTMGLNSTNTAIVYEQGATFKSWVPGREINGISGITAGKGYYIVALQSMDLETYFAPPMPSGSGGGGVQVFNSIPSGTFGTDFFAGDMVIL